MSGQSKDNPSVKLNLKLDAQQVSTLLEEGRRARIDVERRIRAMQVIPDEQLRARVR